MTSKEVKQVFIDCDDEMPPMFNDVTEDEERRNEWNEPYSIYVDFLARPPTWASSAFRKYVILHGVFDTHRQEWVHEGAEGVCQAFKRDDVPAWAHPAQAPTFWDKEVI